MLGFQSQDQAASFAGTLWLHSDVLPKACQYNQKRRNMHVTPDALHWWVAIVVRPHATPRHRSEGGVEVNAMHTSQRAAGTSVPSGWRAAAALHHTAKLSMSCQLCGEAKGPATLASSSRSSMAFASLHA